MTGGNFNAEKRDLIRFASVLKAAGILSPKDSSQIAYDLAEIRDSCRSLPRKIEKFIRMLEQESPDPLQTILIISDLVGEIEYHLPGHLRKAFRKIDKIDDCFDDKMIRGGWSDYLFTLAYSIERGVVRLEKMQAGTLRLPGEPESLLQKIKGDIRKLEGQLRPPDRKARQDGLRRIREWRKRITAAGYGSEFRRMQLAPPLRTAPADLGKQPHKQGKPSKRSAKVAATGDAAP